MYRIGFRVTLREKFNETAIMTVGSKHIYSNILCTRKNIHNFIEKEDIHNIKV